jgi:hypothetical protein
MVNLRVDYRLLESTDATLTSLADEFGSIEAVQADLDGAMGSPAVASAMGNFAGNWTFHRERLIGSMQSLAQMARESVQRFRSADDTLKSDLAGK